MIAAVTQREFWKSAGIHLVRRNSDGWLDFTEDFMRAYYTRPEIHPIEESCVAEHKLFEALMENPFRDVTEREITDIQDKDTADNYQALLGYRDHCLRYKTIEKSYMKLFQQEKIQVPPMFIDQLVHLILRNMLDTVSDTMQHRTAEIFFREQMAMINDGQIMLSDKEIVDMHAENGGFGSLGELLLTSGIPTREVTLDVLTEENKELYWERSDRFDMALDFRFTQPAPDAFARVIQAWIKHFFHVETRVQAQQSIRDQRWSWHVGLDRISSDILNALYQGEDVPEENLSRIAGLFSIEFLDQNDVIETMKNKPVYLALSMDKDNVIRMKPQNLLTNLPLRSVQEQ